ncbi:MAG: site-2 protease family protein [Archangium sp.]|nr:site-2 protease family protein [Archangium sp.]MDP3151097.1 site-2 protease family protein [Archangium sp.]MDP3571781.1 site-2 protease family protein [Archangium sp.]
MSERSGLQFSLLGIPVRIEPWFFIIPLFALQTRDLRGAVIWSVLVFLGVMLHEFGHALAMRAYGFPPSITLHGLGGHTSYPESARPTPRQSFFITLAGPGAGLTLGFIALAARHFITSPNADLQMALSDAVWINIGWSIINLLPILPWDGGHVLDSGLHWATGKRRDRVVALFSIVGGGLIIALAVSQRSILLGYFGAMGLFQGYGRWNLAGQGPPPVTAVQSEDDEKRLQFALMSVVDPQQRAKLTEELAWVRLRKGDFAGARRAVNTMTGATPSISLQARLAATENDVDKVIQLLETSPAGTENERPLLLAALIAKERFDDAVALARRHVELAGSASTRLFEAGAYAQALELCTSERIRTGDGVHAYNEACCLCHLGRLEDAVTALQKAKALGYGGLAQIRTDEDLAQVRNRPEVQALL